MKFHEKFRVNKKKLYNKKSGLSVLEVPVLVVDFIVEKRPDYADKREDEQQGEEEEHEPVQGSLDTGQLGGLEL
jgi:hypothetical protein